MKLIVSEEELYGLSWEVLHGVGVRDTFTIDEIGSQLRYRRNPGEPLVLHYAMPQTWEALKEEFRIFVCTKDKKYSSLRKKLGTTGAKSQTIIVSTIAAAMAPSLGVAVGILVPFCAIVLLALLKVGKEAFCKTCDFRIPIGISSESEQSLTSPGEAPKKKSKAKKEG